MKIAANLDSIDRRVRAAAGRVGRRPEEITLVAVTKTHPVETVTAAYQAGLRHFGENRTQEGQAKVKAMRSWLAASPQREAPLWHFVGYLQTRQAGDTLGHFGLIHSLDRLKLAERIDRLAKRDNYPPVEVLLQGNVSGEINKAGFALDKWASDREQLAAFLETVEKIAGLEKIVIRGLMTMAPLVDDPEKTRPVFQSLAALRRTLQSELPAIDWGQLSMGMTDDFEVAIEEGATIVRLGRAIFGERQT